MDRRVGCETQGRMPEAVSKGAGLAQTPAELYAKSQAANIIILRLSKIGLLIFNAKIVLYNKTCQLSIVTKESI